MSQILYTSSAASALDELLASLTPDRLFVLTDENTERLCLPRLAASAALQSASHICIPAGDTAKTLSTISHVWDALSSQRATRRSALICLGGGMVTDLGGFAAATFKRGIAHINVPTTLLSMVDAAVGGKTGINFNGFKNEIGAFRESHAVLIDTHFLTTENGENLRSGYAEMLKHALLSDVEMWAAHLKFPLSSPDFTALSDLVRQSIEVKQRIVEIDPQERGLRKALNFGHTAGHALESHALSKGAPVLHGKAVAWGMVVELYLSVKHCGFPTDRFRQTVRFILEEYGRPAILCKDYETLFALMQHDKKNTDERINFTLLADVGEVRLDQHASKEEIFEALDFLREG